LPAQVTGFKVDSDGDGTPDDTSAFPNQLQSIVIRGDTAYLPNIAASPAGPLRFNVSPQAFVNLVNGVDGATQTHLDAINLHLGARDPEAGKKRLFFANPWAIAFTSQSGTGAIVGWAKRRVPINDDYELLMTPLSAGLQNPLKQRVRGRRVGIDHRDAAPNKAWLQILREQ
jgi:hypothetical protein